MRIAHDACVMIGDKRGYSIERLEDGTCAPLDLTDIFGMRYIFKKIS